MGDENVSVLVCWGSHNKIPGTGRDLHNRHLVPQVWRLQVQGQGTSQHGQTPA